MRDRILLKHDGIVEEPTWFGPAERPLFGWLAYPEGGRARGAAVICPPVCEEGRAAHRTMRELACRLAQDGLLSFRFDYDGTGDSAGDINDPDFLDRWIDSVDAAVAFARQAASGPVSVVGMRMGATIAAIGAARSRWNPTTLVLWDPCLSGRTFLREQALLHRTMRGVVSSPSDGSIETPGYVFGAAAAAGLSRLRLHEAVGIDTTRTAVKVFFRDDRAPSSTLAEKLGAAGFSMSRAPGQSELLDVPPLDARVPRDMVAEIVRLLGSEAPAGTAESHGMHRVRHVARRETTVNTEWGPVTETLTLVADSRLFGITTRASERSEVTAVFLNVATESHIGPARMWPRLAREWAARGDVAGVRFDLGGIGDSPDVADGTRDRTFLPASIDDVDDVIRELDRDGQRVLLTGVCSGAYAALEGAQQRTVSGVIAVNPILDSIDLTLRNRNPAISDPRRRAARLLPRPLAQLAVEHHRIALVIWRALQRVQPSRAPMAVIAELVHRGTDVLLALSEDDQPPFDVSRIWARRSADLKLTGLFERLDIPALDHPVLVAEGRDRLTDLMTEHVLSRYGRDTTAPSPASANPLLAGRT